MRPRAKCRVLIGNPVSQFGRTRWPRISLLSGQDESRRHHKSCWMVWAGIQKLRRSCRRERCWRMGPTEEVDVASLVCAQHCVTCEQKTFRTPKKDAGAMFDVTVQLRTDKGHTSAHTRLVVIAQKRRPPRILQQQLRTRQTPYCLIVQGQSEVGKNSCVLHLCTSS